ncbi:hypothetical protein ES707_03652 [subsurface metagenome]
MTTETQRQGLGTFVNFEFTLKHPDDHILELLHEGELVARFSQAGATEHSLQEECAKHLVLKHGWDGCVWP